MATPNTLFAILNVSNPDAIEARMDSISPWLPMKLELGQWLLIAPVGTTTKEVSERLGINAGESTGIVLRVDTYYGRNPQSTWEWISTKLGVELGVAVV